MAHNVNNYAGTFNFDSAHTEIGFSARHLMVTRVRGNFNSFTGTATSEENLQNAKINVDIDVASIETGNKDRDEHLRSSDFFEADKFPTITFESTDVKAKNDTTLAVTGDLTIKGVTKEITIDFDFTGEVTDPWGNTRVGFEGEANIDRKDFGLTWNQAIDGGGMMVSEKIGMSFDISAVKEA